MGFLSTPTPAVVKLFCQNKFVKTNVGRTSSRHLARVGREAALGLVVRARPMGQVREERARSHISSAPPRTTRTSESRDHLATSSRVEVDLDSVACTPPPHGSTGFGIWQWPQLLPAARHSTVRRRAACPGSRRDLACSPRAGRGSVLLAKLLGGVITLIFTSA